MPFCYTVDKAFLDISSIREADDVYNDDLGGTTSSETAALDCI